MGRPLPGRRWWVRPLLLGWLLILQSSAASAGTPHTPGSGQPAARAAGPREGLDLLRSSIQAAGGTAFPMEPPAPYAAGDGLGGPVSPLVTLDLNGDGRDEVVAQQGYQPASLMAANGNGVLWRQKLPKDWRLLGALEGDLSADPGEDLVLVGWRAEGLEAVVAILGAHGLRWTRTLEWYTWSLNGFAQADDDPEQELAVTVHDPDTGNIRIESLDGETGDAQSVVHPTIEDTSDGHLTGAEGFVTDGAPGQPDEAVFVTPIGGLWGPYYAERVSLKDGYQVATVILPAVKYRFLYQGPDFTGDGRRDATTFECVLPPLPCSLGVFDAETLSTAWTTESNDQQVDLIGDADGDGGQDPCIEENSFDQAGTFTGATVHCFAGKTGAELWSVTRSIEGNVGYVLAHIDRDLDGDAVLDPIIETWDQDCNEDRTSCVFLSHDLSSFSGRNGAHQWSVDARQEWDFLRNLKARDLDGIAGDDRLQPVWAEDEARFQIQHGVSRVATWEGAIDLPGGFGFVSDAIDANVDGDGASETVFVLYAAKLVGECPNCKLKQGTLLVAFEQRGEQLWRVAV